MAGWCRLSSFVLAACLVSASAGARSPSQADLVAAAREAEQRLEPAEAERLYAEAITRDPTARHARSARRRLEWLRARSEGNYEPLRLLMELRASAPDVGALDAASARVREFSPGIVRRETWAVIGDAYARRGESQKALDAYRAWLASPGLTEGERQMAHSKAALLRAERDGAGPGLDQLRRAALDHRAEGALLRAQRIGDRGTPIAVAVMLLFAALGGWCARRSSLAALGRAFSIPKLALGAWLLGVPLALVWIYDRSLVAQVGAVMGALAVALAAASSLGAADLDVRWRRRLAPLAALTVLAAAFLALDGSRLLFDILWSIEQAPH